MKSRLNLTMVFVARMLRASRDLNDYKILLINDRVDLEDQLAGTATLIGGRINTIESSHALREQLGTDSSDINMVKVHKFQVREQSLPLKVSEALNTYMAIPSSQTFGVVKLREFVEGKLGSVEEDAAVVHEAVKVLKDERVRADFDVYLKKFLMSMDIILPHRAAHAYRVPAKRLGYILRVTKERYKDTSMNLGDAGQKVRDFINEHLISLGINPKVPPVELLSEDFIENLNKHAAGNAEAKASEMEHAIRKHCTVHHDEDPAFYQSLSQKVERLIDQYQDQVGKAGGGTGKAAHDGY